MNDPSSLGNRLANVPVALGMAVVAAFLALGFLLNARPRTRVYAVGLWVMTSAGAALLFPAWFTRWGSFSPSSLIVPFTQLIMLGMGATLSLRDFTRVAAAPRTVLTGIVLQFAVMPPLGYLIARGFGFPPEIGAGIILIGACSGGVASNVMTFLARGDVAVSVTMTAFSTLASAVMTPLAMKLLAGAMVPVNLADMMIGIIKLTIAPVALGLLLNALLGRYRRIVVERILPTISLFLVCFTLALIAANVRERLLQVGALLVLAAVLHNVGGLLLGYFGARGVGLPEASRRTIAFEVGMQNGGMGVALAVTVLGSPDAAIASGVFAVCMNFTGALLASWWRDRPPGQRVELSGVSDESAARSAAGSSAR